MKYTSKYCASNAMALAILSALANGCLAADGQVLGKMEYETNCVSCHGVLAKGDGDMAKTLAPAPADLTLLAAKNNGEFPAPRVRQVIDGRAEKNSGAHGSRAMPVWGDVYSADDGQPQELNVRNRIDALVDYLRGLQVR